MITGIFFLVFLLMGMPIVIVLCASTVIFLIQADATILMETAPLQLYKSVDRNGLLAIPMFMLVGELMNKGGITSRLIDLADLMVGRFRGGLAYVNLLTNTFAAAILGSASAQIAVMTRTMVPAMVDRKYSLPFSTAVTVAGGMLGPVIPPSMLLIIYGVVSYQSVAALFIAGVVPGLLIASGFALVIFILGYFHEYPDKNDYVAKPVWQTIRAGLLPLLIPLVIIVGVVGGVMTPTESGAIASLLALILGKLFYRKLSFTDLQPLLCSVALNSALIVSLIGVAAMFGWTLAFESIPDMLALEIQRVSSSPLMFLFLVSLMIILLGMVIDGIGVMIVVVPILLPIMASFGIDPLQFGIVISISTLVGLITPPVGPGLYIAMEATGIRMGTLFLAVVPFLFSLLISLALIAMVPAISTWLPEYFGLH